MPLPKPKKGETRDAFIERCMTSTAAQEFPTKNDKGQNQRLAVCEAQYDHKKSTLSFGPQRFDGLFKLTSLSTRSAGDPPTAEIPKGCCGRMTGVALVYEVRDEYGTMFARGCLAQTIAEKVRTGKVRLFADHIPLTRTHVGTVVDIKDVGDSAVMSAVIFDTEPGRAMKEYLEAVLSSGQETGASTGLSVGFRSIEDEGTMAKDEDGIEQWACRFLEISLSEISVTPVNAVPGSDVLSVRREQGDDTQGDLLKRMLARILASVPESEARAVFNTAYASAADPAHNGADPTGATPATQPAAADGAAGSESSTASASAPAVVSLEERRKIARDIFGPPAASPAS